MRAAAAPSKAIPGRYIVMFKSNANVDDTIDEIGKVKANSAKGRVRHRYNSAFRGLAFELPEQASDQAKEQLLAKLRSRADVDFISPDYEVKKYGAAGAHHAHKGLMLSAFSMLATASARTGAACIARHSTVRCKGHAILHPSIGCTVYTHCTQECSKGAMLHNAAHP